MPDIQNRADKENRLKALIVLLFQQQQDWLDEHGEGSWLVFESRMRRQLAPELASIYSDGANRLLTEQGLSWNADRLSAASSNWADRYSLQLAQEITQTTQSRYSTTRNASTAGTIDEEKLDETIDQLFDEARAEMIAITETTRANTVGEFGGAREFTILSGGKILAPTWHCEDDACPICAPLDGTGEEEWGDEFPEGPPSPHPSCRCWLTWEVVSLEYGDGEQEAAPSLCEGGAGSGPRFGGSHPHAGNPTGRTAVDRSRQAKASYNPSTKEKQDLSDRFEAKVAKALDMDRTDDNRPMDHLSKDGKVGVEVKMLHDAKEDRVNMRPDSRMRKEAWLNEEPDRHAFMLVNDARDTFQNGAHTDNYSGHHLYIAERIGAVSLKSMTPVSNLAQAKAFIAARIK